MITQRASFGDPRLPATFWRQLRIDDSGCWAWTLHFLPEARALYAARIAAGEYCPDPDLNAWKWAEWLATIPTQSGKCPPWLGAVVEELAMLAMGVGQEEQTMEREAA